MGARKLHAVPDEPEVPVSTQGRQSVETAASSSRRNLLVALRDKIASEIDTGVPARDLASLSNRLMQIAAEIAQIDAGEEGDDVGNAADTPDEAWTDT